MYLLIRHNKQYQGTITVLTTFIRQLFILPHQSVSDMMELFQGIVNGI